jgi:hypothetical protein
MKQFQFSIIIFLSLLTPANGQKFIHPGILNTKQELNFVKAKVNAGQQPWISGYNKMMSDKGSSLSFQPSPCASFTFDSCRTQLRGDGAAAYSHALQYYIKGNAENAKKAIQIMNSWATTTKFKQSCLATTWGMPRMILAAEIIKYSYSGWAASDEKRFADWLRNDVWPFASGCESDRSNWDSGGIALSLEIAVYLDDRAKFNSAVDRLRNFIPIYIKDGGCNNESDRDQAHAQMGIGHLAVACEVAWKQGVDAYSFHNNRVFHGYEFTAKYNLGESVSGCGMSSKWRGDFHPIYEIPFNHYQNRKKMSMPYTARAVQKSRPEGVDIHMVPWGTLTHADLGNLSAPLDPEPQTSFTLSLKSGWNLISLPVEPENTQISSVLSPINGQIEAIYAFNNSRNLYQSYIPGHNANDLHTLETGSGYWIYASKSIDLTIKGNLVSAPIGLKAGWNLVGVNSLSILQIKEAVKSIEPKLEAIYLFDNGSNIYRSYQPSGASEFGTLNPGSGYWVYVTEDISWRQTN